MTLYNGSLEKKITPKLTLDSFLAYFLSMQSNLIFSTLQDDVSGMFLGTE